MHPLTRFRLSHKPKPMSRADLGRMVGMDRTAIFRVETGERQVSLALLPKVVEATGIPAVVLRPDLRALLEQAAE